MVRLGTSAYGKSVGHENEVLLKCEASLFEWCVCVSLVAILIALPATAYAAVCPQQFSAGHTNRCSEPSDACFSDFLRCGAATCLWSRDGTYGGYLSTAVLPLANWEVRSASKSVMWSVSGLDER